MFMHLAQQIASVPDSVWVIIGGVLGLSTLQQVLKHYVDGLSEKTNMLLTMALSGLLASGDYLTSAVGQNPTVLGPETAGILGLMTVTYRYIVKPFYNLLVDARQYRAASKPAVETAPLAPAAPAVDEFAG